MLWRRYGYGDDGLGLCLAQGTQLGRVWAVNNGSSTASPPDPPVPPQGMSLSAHHQRGQAGLWSVAWGVLGQNLGKYNHKATSLRSCFSKGGAAQAWATNKWAWLWESTAGVG